MGVTLTIENTKFFLGLDGSYRIQNVPTGSHTLRINYVSYRSRTRSVTMERVDQIVTLDLPLQTEDNCQLTEVTAKAKRDGNSARTARDLERSALQITNIVSGRTIELYPDLTVANVIQRYYSDEGVGVRKYYADLERANTELVLFAKTGFAQDHEGISIYKTGPKTGYLLVSDQGASQFHIFRREGELCNPNEHKLLKVVKVAAQVSDGSEVTNVPLGKQFPHGLFIAVSEGKTFHYYRWEDIAGNDLK